MEPLLSNFQIVNPGIALGSSGTLHDRLSQSSISNGVHILVRFVYFFQTGFVHTSSVHMIYSSSVLGCETSCPFLLHHFYFGIEMRLFIFLPPFFMVPVQWLPRSFASDSFSAYISNLLQLSGKGTASSPPGVISCFPCHFEPGKGQTA